MGAAKGLGEMQILAKSLSSSCIFSSRQGSVICTTNQWRVGGGWVGWWVGVVVDNEFPLWKIRSFKILFKFCKTPLMVGLAGRKGEGHLCLSCYF